MSTPLVPLSAHERNRLAIETDPGHSLRRAMFYGEETAVWVDRLRAGIGRLLALYDAEKARGDSLERERDEARAQIFAAHAERNEADRDLAVAQEQVRSLTVERDAARLPEAERADLWGMIADRDRRFSRAREALGLLLHCGPKGYELEALMDTPEEAQALAALRAALAEPLGGGP